MPRLDGVGPWVRGHAWQLGTATVCVLATFAVVTAWLFIWPSTDAVGDVDAVVLFAGGRGERLELAEHLMDEGHADNLVIPNGLLPTWPDGNRACTESRAYDVHCPRPDPDTTRGEARVIAELAERMGWDRVVVVTSSYQVARAGLLLGRCFDGEVLTQRAQPELEPWGWILRIGHEWLGWSQAVLVERGC